MTLRLLAIFPHPDDETLGVGGTLARYASEGVEISLITATLGEGGRFRGLKPGEGHPGARELGRIREAELRAAIAILGVRELVLLGYPDGGLAAVNALEITTRIAAEVRRLEPHVVITFSPDGAYGHPDHIAMSQFATAGVVAAGSPDFAAAGEPHAVSKLYYFVVSERHANAYIAGVREVSLMVDGAARNFYPWPNWSVTTRIPTAAHWETVKRAIAAHESQVATYGERLMNLSPEHHAAIWGQGEFYRAFSLVNGGRGVETDLFEGLRAAAPAESTRA